MVEPKNDIVRTRLIESAAALFLEQGFHAVSIRAVAQRSQTTSAMINYYFKSKHGLFEEMLKYQYGKIFSLVLAETEHQDPLDYALFIKKVMKVYRENPGMAEFLIKGVEINKGPGSQYIKDLFIMENQLVKKHTDELKAQGKVHENIDSEVVRILLLCVTLLPSYMSEGLKSIYGDDEFDQFQDRFADFVGGIIRSAVYKD